MRVDLRGSTVRPEFPTMPFLRPLPFPGATCPYQAITWRSLKAICFGSVTRTRQEAVFPSFITLGFLKLGEGGWVTRSVCGVDVEWVSGHWRDTCSWAVELWFYSHLFIPYNCGKKTKPLRMCSISQKDKIMSIFLAYQEVNKEYILNCF